MTRVPSTRRTFLAVAAIVAAIAGDARAFAKREGKLARGAHPAHCESLFLSTQADVSRWGKYRERLARSRMMAGFRSTDGQVAGATKAAAIDPRGEYNGLWIRDNAVNVKEVADVADIEEAYIAFSRSNLTHDMAGIPIDDGLPYEVRAALATANGEPKFNADGSKFRHWWGRPQNDGPAYRALRWMEYTEKKLAAGKTAEALRNYNPDLGALSVKWDLEYLAHHWRSPSYDLWEEEMGTHFHTLVVIADALEKGARLAERLEPEAAKSGAAAMYREQAAAIRRKILAEAWDPVRGHIRSIWRHDGGFVKKNEPLDISIILGLLHTSSQPPVLRLGDDRVLATMETLERRFGEIYRLNQQFADPRFRGAVALGRYTEDVFHGGNPWVIATQAGAEFYYKLGAELLAAGDVGITRDNQAFFARLLRRSAESADLEVGRTIRKGSRPYDELLDAIRDKGDAYLEIVRSRTGPDGFHAEQFGRGYEPGDQGPWVRNYLEQAGSDGSRTIPGGKWLGAQMLVWNEASFSSAWKSRLLFLKNRALQE
jgi:glucoamylase